MLIFLTGSTGFLGSHFLKAALTAQVQVRALRRLGSTPRIPLPAEPEWIEGGLSEAKPDWFNGCDVVVHLAAAGVSPQVVTWSQAMQVNVSYSMHLVEAAQKSGVSRFLICGTCMEYGRSAEKYQFIPADAELLPSGPYASSKAAYFVAMRAFVEHFNLKMTYLRPFHFFGQGQFESNFWPSLHKAALAGEDFPMTLGEQIRDFIPVEDVARRFLDEATLIHHRDSRLSPHIRVANVGTGQPQTLRHFAEAWWKKWGAQGQLKLGAIPYRKDEVMRYVPDVAPVQLQ